MATTPNGSDALDRVRDALFDAGRKATRLAESVERLEARYARAENPNREYFHVPTDVDGTRGRTLEPGWTDHAPERERRPRREAIDATLALRAAVDSAIEAVAGIAAYMDSEAESVVQRWTTRTIGHLRDLRGAIVRGHGDDYYLSALPMIRAGVPGALREHAQHVSQRMEEVKSVILAGIKPRTPTVSVSPDLLAQLERAAALSLPDHRSAAAVEPSTFDEWVQAEVNSLRVRHPKIAREMLTATLETLEMARAEREDSIPIGILDCSPWRWNQRPESERRAIRLAVLRSLHDGRAHDRIVNIPDPIEGKFAPPFDEITLAEWVYLTGDPIGPGQDLDSKRGWMFKGLTCAAVKGWVEWVKEEAARMFGTGDTTAENLDSDAARKLVYKPGGWTKSEIVQHLEVAAESFSPSTFDTIRKRAGVKPAPKGGKGPHHCFSITELKKLKAEIDGGRYQRKADLSAALDELIERSTPKNESQSNHRL